MDSLDPDLRALIDEAIDEGRVTRVPQGKMATQPDFVWCEDKQKIVHRDPKNGKAVFGAGINAFYRRMKRKPMPKDPKVTERRNNIPGHIEAGWSRKKIADHYGVSVSAISQDARVLGISLKPKG